MQRFSKSIALLLTACTFAGSLTLKTFPTTSRRVFQSSTTSLHGTDDQIINDLNLEEMFEVFEAAGKLIYRFHQVIYYIVNLFYYRSLPYRCICLVRGNSQRSCRERFQSSEKRRKFCTIRILRSSRIFGRCE